MNNFKQLTGKIKSFFNHITVKQILFIIIFGLAISIASCVIGYIEFSSSINSVYETEVKEIASFIKDNLDLTEFENNLKVVDDNFYNPDNPALIQIGNQPGYKQFSQQMGYLQKNFDGLSFFIGTYRPDYTKPYLEYQKRKDPTDEVIKYLEEDGDIIVAVYYRSANMSPEDIQKNHPGGLFVISDEEKETVLDLYKNKISYSSNTELMDDKTNEVSHLVSLEEPILNNSGDVIGFINVSITVNIINRLLSRYLFLVGLLTILIGIIFIIVYILINRKIFLKPILNIIDSTRNFVKNNTEITESLTEIKTGDEIQTLAESIYQLEKDINEYIKNLALITAERERVKTELELATNIQMSVLPQELPEVDNRNEFDIAAVMNPAREVGGDFYNYFMIDKDHLGFVVGDVSGKGIPAALFMMIGTILIKTQSLPDEAVNTIIEKVNDILCEHNAEMLFITAWMGIYEISTGTVTFINAGHEPPVLIHENGEIELVKTKPNLALATFEGLSYRLNSIKLKKGDKLFLYTDGVVEAQNKEDQFYKEERLIEIIKEIKDEDVDTIVKHIREDIDVFANGAEQFDDITIFGLEIKKEPEE